MRTAHLELRLQAAEVVVAGEKAAVLADLEQRVEIGVAQTHLDVVPGGIKQQPTQSFFTHVSSLPIKAHRRGDRHGRRVGEHHLFRVAIGGAGVGPVVVGVLVEPRGGGGGVHERQRGDHAWVRKAAAALAQPVVVARLHGHQHLRCGCMCQYNLWCCTNESSRAHVSIK